MSNSGLVKVTLTKAEAQWLYDILADKFDEGASTGRDELMCSEIADKVDAAWENDMLVSKLEELGFKIVHSGPCPIQSWGKHWIHANKVNDVGCVYGYGDDEASAIQDALTELGKP